MTNIENNYTVYIHITPSNKYYIGITARDIKIRWNNGNGYRNNKYFWNAIQKYGWDNIEHIVYINNISKEEACKFEKELIKKYDSTNRLNGYNHSLGGEINKGWKLTDEQKNRVGDGHKGIKFTNERCERISNSLKGRKLSEEHIKAIKESHKGLKRKQESINKTKIPVLQFDVNMIFIKEWESAQDVKNELELSTCGNIGKCCKGERKTAFGYIWRYKNGGKRNGKLNKLNAS